MGRKLKRAKPLIYVFCEGESEQAYADFLRRNKLKDGCLVNFVG